MNAKYCIKVTYTEAVRDFAGCIYEQDRELLNEEFKGGLRAAVREVKRQMKGINPSKAPWGCVYENVIDGSGPVWQSH